MLLLDACSDASIATTMLFIKKLVQIIFIIAPVLLILLLAIDFTKAVMANDDNRIKHLKDVSIKRIAFAIVLFFVPLIVDTSFSLLSRTGSSAIGCYNEVDSDIVNNLVEQSNLDKETKEQERLQTAKDIKENQAEQAEKRKKFATRATKLGTNGVVSSKYVPAKRVAEATSNHTGCIYRCKLGDQGSGKYGNEVLVSKWRGSWDYIWRPADPVVANKAALCMEKAALNKNIGYGREGGYPYTWNSLWKYMSKRKDWDPANVKDKVSVSCCPMVAVCLKYAGYKPDSGLGCVSNSAMKKDLKKAGKFVQVYPGGSKNISNIKRGDVLMWQSGSAVHMAMAV